MNSFKRFSTLALSAAISQLLASPTVLAQEQRSSGIEEVVVTAQKREQSLQDVPIAISAFGADQVETRGIADIEGLNGLAPNVRISKAPASATASQIAIRGSAQQNPAPYWDQPVGMYIDGVYFGKSLGSIFDVVDIERIEVLRGPQGTLYGRNTLAGALSIITRKPSGEFSGSAMVGVGNYDRREAKVSMDLPRVGIASASFGLQKLRRDGLVDIKQGPASEAANRDNVAGRFALNLAFSENFEADYRFDHTNIDQEPPLSQLYRSDLGIPGMTASKHRISKASLDVDTYEKVKVNGHSLTLSWDVNDHNTLKSISSYRKMDWDDSIDLDGTIVGIAHTSRDSVYKQKSQEFQLIGNVDRWNYVAGLYYFKDDGKVINPQEFFYDIPGFATFYDSRYGFTTKSVAAYGQLDYQLTDALTLTLGLRRTEEKKTGSRYLGINFAPNDPNFIGLIPQVNGSKDFSATTPLISLGYQLSDDHSVYAKYSEGFKSGGYNGEYSGPNFDSDPAVEAGLRDLRVGEVLTPFKPQKMKSFEVGYKGRFLGGIAQLNTAVFFNKNEDMQLSIFTATGASGSIVRNAGEAETKGVEIEGILLPTDWLKLQVSYGYLHSEYKKFMDSGVDQANNRAMIFSPKHTFDLLVDARLGETSYGTWRAIADYMFQSSWYSYAYQLASSGPNYDPTQPLARNVKVDSAGFLNLRLALTDIPFCSGTGEVALWGRNVTDKKHVSNYIDFGPGFGNLTTAYWDDPRTYGASFTYRW